MHHLCGCHGNHSRQILSKDAITEEEATSDEEECPPPRWGNNLKSGMQRTAASTVIHKVTWPHEVVYTSEDNPASKQELTIPLFVQGYLIVMELEEGRDKKLMSTHRQDLMSDTQWYGWDKVRTFHGVWLNQIEQGRCTWTDKEEKLNFHRALVWHPASTSLSAAHPLPMNQGGTRHHNHKPPSEYHAPARPGTKNVPFENIDIAKNTSKQKFMLSNFKMNCFKYNHHYKP